MLKVFSAFRKLKCTLLYPNFDRLVGFTLSFCSLSLIFTIAACSPSSFFGSGEDSGVAGTRNYRRINLACAGIDLSSSTVDVPTFRKLLHCFNSNGGLDPIERLVNRLSDSEVRPLVDFSNRYVLNSNRMMYQIERTYYSLNDRKILDNTFKQLGRLLENKEFVMSGVALLKEGYAHDRNVLRAVEHIATKIKPDGVADVLDVGLTLARAQAFTSVQGWFKGSSPGDRELRDLTDQALTFLQDTADPEHVEAGTRLINEVISGNLFSVMDSVMGTDAESLRTSVPRVASFMNVTMASDAQIFDGLTSLFHYVHRPIHCLKGAMTLPDGAMHVFSELDRVPVRDAATFMKYKNTLILMAMNPFCDFPVQVGKYYPAMFQLADSTAIQPATELLQAAYRLTVNDPVTGAVVARPIAELLADVLGDTGSAYAERAGGPAENTAGIKRLLPVMAELTDRGVWNDAMLLMSLPRQEDRQGLQESLQFIMNPIPGLDRSIFQVLSDAVSRTTPESFYNFAYSLRHFVWSDNKILEPGVAALRQAFYVNDVHPFVNLSYAALKDATINDDLIDMLMKASEMSEFGESIELVSEMAQDGRLKELLGAVVTLFHKFSAKGRFEIHEGVEPVFVPLARHDWAHADVFEFPIGDEPSLANESCRKVDLSVSFADYRDPRFNDQVDHYGSCMNSDDAHSDVQDVLGFLRSYETEDHRNYLEQQIDLVKSLGMNKDQLRYMSDLMAKTYDDGRLDRVLAAMPLFIQKTIHGEVDGAGAGGPLLRPLFEFFRPVMQNQIRPGIQRLEAFSASVLKRADFPVLLKYLDDLWDREPEPVIAEEPLDYDWNRIRRWVWNKECERLPPNPTENEIERYKNRRAWQLVHDSNKAVTTWDLVNGQQRLTWQFDEFRTFMNDLVTKLGDPLQSAQPRGATQAVLNALKYFSLPDNVARPNEQQHYHRDELIHFLMDRSSDYRMITYIYPGERTPRVKIVSTMDRLELVLMAADFFTMNPSGTAQCKKSCNMGMFFLAQIADAWGDEDPAIWPQIIKDKVARGEFGRGRPPKLSEAVAAIKTKGNTFRNLVGTPELPRCRQVADPHDPPDVQHAETTNPTSYVGTFPAVGLDVPLLQKQLYNIDQLTDVMYENLPLADQPPKMKNPKMANGMRILRDLFFQIYYSTPELYRTAEFPDKTQAYRNNLSVIFKLVRTGLTRQATRVLRGMDPNDPALKDFFYGLIEASTVPNIHALLDPLFDASSEVDPQHPRHDLFWNVIQRIFGIVDAADGVASDETHRQEIAGKSPQEVEEIKAKWKKELARMKQMAFYTVAQSGKLGLTNPFLGAAGPILKEYRGYLTQNADKLDKVLREEKVSYLMRALYEDTDVETKDRLISVMKDFLAVPQNGLDGMAAVKALDEDAAASLGWDQVWDRWDTFEQLPEYKALKLDEISRDLLDFFENQGTSPEARATAYRLREYAAELMLRGETDQLMLLGKSNPDELYRVLQTMSRYSENGELKDFFGMARRSLSESGR